MSSSCSETANHSLRFPMICNGPRPVSRRRRQSRRQVRRAKRPVLFRLRGSASTASSGPALRVSGVKRAERSDPSSPVAGMSVTAVPTRIWTDSPANHRENRVALGAIARVRRCNRIRQSLHRVFQASSARSGATRPPPFTGEDEGRQARRWGSKHTAHGRAKSGERQCRPTGEDADAQRAEVAVVTSPPRPTPQPASRAAQRASRS